MNLHTPERGPRESFADYKRRRKLSHETNRLNGKPEGWKPEPRKTGSPFISKPLLALFNGDPQPKLKKRKKART